MKIKNTKWIILKWIAYITLPFLVAFIIMNIAVINEVSFNSSKDYEASSYYESNFFYDKVNSDLLNAVIHANEEGIHYYEPMYTTSLNNEEYGVVNHFYSRQHDFDLIYIDHDYKIIYVNRESIELEDIEKEDFLGKYYYKNINGNVESTIGENIKFYDRDLEDVDIYFSLDEINYTSDYYWNDIWYDMVENYFDIAFINIIASGVLGLFLLVSMFIGIGKSRNSNEVKNIFIDKMPLEILLGISIVVIIAVSNFLNYNYYIYDIDLILLAGSYYIIALIIFTSLLRRIKKGNIFTNTLVYKFAKKVIKFFYTISENIYIAIILFCLAVINILILAVGFNILLFIIYVFIWGIIGRFIYSRYKMTKKISNLISNIYENNEYKINKEDYSEDYLEVALKLDKISSGFNEALDSKLASERMKSELITNVSHDIKTPLTSIINYIDLLKREKIKDKQVCEYINVLSNKADRLKKLTEDLVELSKASSGNLKMDFSKINLYELISQLSGEYEEKFNKANLEVEFNSDLKNLFIKADTRYIYRIFDNLYSNALKYSMKNTRIYINAMKSDNNIIVEIKNISKDKLNISKEELMQRFVRGESSRTSDGSGLGLSIVENLVSLQEGNFDITIDGDLFKVSINFRKW